MSFPPSTSSQSTTPEPDSGVLEKLENTRVTPLDQTAAALEQRLQHEIDLRKEERFFWIAFTSLLLDGLMFKFLEFSLLCWPMFILQLVLLIGVAGWLGVDRVVVVLERLLNKYLPSKTPRK